MLELKHGPKAALTACCPQSKHKLYLDRLQLIGQRMRRNKLFQQHTQLLAGSSEELCAQVRSWQPSFRASFDLLLLYACFALASQLHCTVECTVSASLNRHSKKQSCLICRCTCMHFKLKLKFLHTLMFGLQLTDLQSLRGIIGQPRIVMGCISRAEDGR